MKVIIAPDKFKYTFSAVEVTAEIASSFGALAPSAEVRRCPMADGGEGTAEILGGLLGLKPRRRLLKNARMDVAEVMWYEDEATVALDSASVVGLAMLGGPRTPFRLSSYPLGKLVAMLLNEGKKRIIIGIGGTATVDGGAGFLQGLGAEFRDADGKVMERVITAVDLPFIGSVDLSGVDPRVKEVVEGWADVALPLLPGAEGEMSTLSFAPQKGVKPHEIGMLAAGLENYKRVVCGATAATDSFGGAGGGLGFAMETALGCRMSRGADELIRLYGIFDEPLPDLIITGEGRFDEQSMRGKVVGELCRRAGELQRCDVVAVVGRSAFNDGDSAVCLSPGMFVYAIDPDPDSDRPLNLSEASKNFLRFLHSEEWCGFVHDVGMGQPERTFSRLINKSCSQFGNC